MKIIDFEVADHNLTRISIVTEPKMSQKVFDVAKDLLKNLNFPSPSLNNGRLVFANAQILTNPMNMERLKQALNQAEEQILDAQRQEDDKKTRYLNQFLKAAGLPLKQPPQDAENVTQTAP